MPLTPVKSDDPIHLALQSLFQHYDPACLEPGQDLDLLREMLRPRGKGGINGLVQLTFQGVTRRCPRPIRELLLGLAHRLRSADPGALKEPDQCEFNRLVAGVRAQGPLQHGYAGKRAALCLSYDVDLLSCYQYLPTLLDLLYRHGLKATFHLLTGWEYQLDPALVKEVAARGHEVGLHGASHDVALGYRRDSYIARELRRALRVLGEGIYSYRAPALCMTARLMAQIKEFGFCIDSSLPMSSMFYPSTQSCFPYPLDSSGVLWELPILIQDSTLFLDLGLSQDEAWLFVENHLRQVLELGGVAVINLHPSWARKYHRFHQRLLQTAQSWSEFAVLTHKEVYDLCRSRLATGDKT